MPNIHKGCVNAQLSAMSNKASACQMRWLCRIPVALVVQRLDRTPIAHGFSPCNHSVDVKKEAYGPKGMSLAFEAGIDNVKTAPSGTFGAASMAERRTKEIGIRKAMGANTSDILRLLLWQFAQPVLWSIGVAWVISGLLMNRGCMASRITWTSIRGYS